MDIVWTELVAEVSNLEKGLSDKHYVVDETNKTVYVFGHEDIDLITDQYNDLKIIGLANHFQIDIKTMNWVLNKLNEKGCIGTSTVKNILKLKDQPAMRVWFEPAQVSSGEETTLNVEIFSPNEIEDARLVVEVPEDLELEYKPPLPSKILRGKRLEKHRYKTTRNGNFEIQVILEGMSEGIQFSEKTLASPLIVKALPPEVYVDLKLGRDEIAATFQRDCTVNLAIYNKGAGDAQNIEIKGFDKHPEFSVISFIKIGNLAAHAKVDYPLVVKPRKSGHYGFGNLVLVYEDLDGKSFHRDVPDFDIDVKTPQPRLKVGIDMPPYVKASENFNIRIGVSNSGEGDARNISFTLPIDSSLVQSGRIDFYIPRLMSGEMEGEQINLRAPPKGKIQIADFNVQFEDVEGMRKEETIVNSVTQVRENSRKDKDVSELPWPFVPGHSVGKFLIKEEIGEGGFSKVYLATHRLMQEDRAIKALRVDFVSNANLVEEFIKEAQISMKLISRNIVRVHDVEIETRDGVTYPYIVMEHLDGGTLEENVSPGNTMDFLQSLIVIQDMYFALDYAHKSGYYHCDIKPSNIFHDKQEEAWKLGDFGLARLAQIEGMSHIRGTLEYMAPEVKQKGTISAASDIYSLGMVFRWMLTGESMGNLKTIKRSSSVNRDQVNRLVDLIERMTSPRPADRPALQEVWKVVRWSITGREG